MNAKEVSVHKIVRIQMEVLNANVSMDTSYKEKQHVKDARFLTGVKTVPRNVSVLVKVPTDVILLKVVYVYLDGRVKSVIMILMNAAALLVISAKTPVKNV